MNLNSLVLEKKYKKCQASLLIRTHFFKLRMFSAMDKLDQWILEAEKICLGLYLSNLDLTQMKESGL